MDKWKVGRKKGWKKGRRMGKDVKGWRSED